MQTKLIHSDSLEALKNLPDNSVDSVVTDPPYGLSFMGKKWDYDVPSEAIWRECLRVLKPGGHLLAFAGTRTQHRMAVRIEDAGFEIRDMIAWVYGSGFPKSHDVSKAIDKAAGAEREVIGTRRFSATNSANFRDDGWQPDLKKLSQLTAPATDAARQWQGWGTSLKPALEPITVARKPLIGTVAENVLEWGTGALNIDGCRVGAGELVPGGGRSKRGKNGGGIYGNGEAQIPAQPHIQGRWPANLIHDGSDEVLAKFPHQKSPSTYTRAARAEGEWLHAKEAGTQQAGYGDSGSAARFFYCPKASKKDRDEGLEEFEVKRTGGMQATADGSMLTGSGNERTTARANTHPTVKPTDLMRYLCRLVTPPNGTVLDPFMGSGSTGKAAMLEGFNFIGIEREAEYIEIAKARINWTLLC